MAQSHHHDLEHTHDPAHSSPAMHHHGSHTSTAPAGGGHGDQSGHSGHDDHAAAFERLFWISTILSVPVVLYSQMIQDWLGYSMPEFAGSGWISPVLGTIVFLVGGRVFLAGGWDELNNRQPGMMALISMAISVAFITSILSSFDVLDLEFWWELVLLIDIMLLGHWLEMRAIGQASDALSALASLLPDDAERIRVNETTEIVPLSQVAEGDLLLVRPGGRIPADGTIERGDADIDESMLTGEARPVTRGEGDHVVAGSVVQGAAIRIRVDAIGEHTALAGIQRLVSQAQESNSRAQALADRFAGWLFYIATGTAVITFVAWLAWGDVDDAIIRTITVLVISCPHALGLAIPLVIAMSTSAAARQGVLVKDRRALEAMRNVNTVVFDKTGTLTEGSHTVSALTAISGDDAALLAIAAAVEQDSEHPLAKAIVSAAEDRSLDIPMATNFSTVSGRGVTATINGTVHAVGGPRLLKQRDVIVPPALQSWQDDWSARGASVLAVIRDDTIIGLIALEDTVRASARQAIAALHDRGIETVMMTGDARSVAERVAAALGIDRVLAEVLPEDKAGEIRRLQHDGRKVAMVGDGVNDAPALAGADVGIAIGAGTDVAIESAEVILASSDPRAVESVIRLSQASYRKMVQNLWWAAGYNIIAIPLAAGVLAGIGLVLPPAAGAVLMSLSTIVVAVNAMSLRRLDLSL